MPIVQVSLHSGRSSWQKKELAVAITKAISENLYIKDSQTTITFQDIEKDSWSVGGKMASED